MAKAKLMLDLAPELPIEAVAVLEAPEPFPEPAVEEEDAGFPLEEPPMVAVEVVWTPP